MEYFFKIAKTCSIREIVDYNLFYIVNPVNGCWSVISAEDIDFVSMFVGKTIHFRDLHLSKSHLSLLKTLFHQGILEINNKSYYTEQVIREAERVITIIINTTNGCNIHCKYCYAYSNEKTYVKFSPASIIADITKLVGNNENQKISIVFHGGEPLLCWDNIVEMIIKLNSRFKNISYSIQTNGILITKQMVNFVKSNKIKIGISLDGFNKQANINRFGKDNNNFLKRVLDNIDVLMHNNILIGLLSVITKENYRDLFDSVIFFVDKGVKHFGFNFFLSKGRGADKNTEVLVNELVDIYIKLACYINDYNAHHVLEDYISERTISVLIYSLSHKPLGACFSTPCSAGKNLFAIDVNGDIYPCDEFVGDVSFRFGNIRIGDFSTENIKNDNFTKLSHRNNNSIEKCKLCQINRLCPFKCPSDSYYRTGDLFQPHSMCEFTKLILPKYMYLLQQNIISSRYFIFN